MLAVQNHAKDKVTGSHAVKREVGKQGAAGRASLLRPSFLSGHSDSDRAHRATPNRGLAKIAQMPDIIQSVFARLAVPLPDAPEVTSAAASLLVAPIVRKPCRCEQPA